MTAAPELAVATRLVHPERYDAAVRRLFARRPERMVPGLARIRSLCREAGDPQHSYDTVHLTGTNGKTSTARMVTSLLIEHGWRVGTYTSPHLQDVRERIRIDGVPIGRSEFVSALERLDRQIAVSEQELGEMITFFEALTCLGASSFRDAGVEAGVIEVGMGGRLDATNVHEARVAVIGTVALDHPELGSTIPEVAREKAGIIADDAVVVVGPQPAGADRVIAAEARSRGARLRRAGSAFGVISRQPVPGGQDVRLRVGSHDHLAHLPLRGAHQATNAACALAAVEALLADHGGLCPDAVRMGFARVRSPGRLEVFERPGQATVVLDGAHNPEGTRSLALSLPEVFSGRAFVPVLGVLEDKDVEGVVAPILEFAKHTVVATSPAARGMPAECLAATVRRCGGRATIAPGVDEAIRAATQLAGPDGVVVITGSLYLVGAARAALGGDVG